MNKGIKLLLSSIAISGGLVLIAMGGIMYIDSCDEVYYETYTLNSQYIGDCNGYEDCLIMEVSPAHFDDDLTLKIANESITLYYGEEHELYDAESGDVIVVRWLENSYLDSRRIDGIEVIG